MTLTHILVFIAAAILYTALLPARWKPWALFVGSIIAITWLQPAVRIRTLDFVFPAATLALVIFCWAVTRAPGQSWTREDSWSAGIVAILVILLALNRYIAPEYRITPSMPPQVIEVVTGAALVGALLALLVFGRAGYRFAIPGFILLLAGALVILKTEALATEASRVLRRWQGQEPSLASAAELEWLGFSYVAFRLIHTLRDRQSGKLPPVSLREYVTYAIFFPAFTAGPIDRAERFVPALRQIGGPDPVPWVQGGMRITLGIGKKFVIADSLALFALNSTKAGQATSAGGLWVLLYAFALQIYFDFSGYSDIAIGLGQLFGIKLPENFNLPYLKRNITLFWQSWHITLSQWVRFYVFSPLTRFLLMRKRQPSPTLLALIGQCATMLVIGLWHGVTWGFVAWALWHAIGLFVHKVWSDRTRPLYLKLRERPRLGQLIGAAGVVLTFHYVVLGWVWFALSDDITQASDVFLRLFGL